MLLRDAQNRNAFALIAATMILFAVAKWSGFFSAEIRPTSQTAKRLAAGRPKNYSPVKKTTKVIPDRSENFQIPSGILAILTREKNIAEKSSSQSTRIIKDGWLSSPWCEDAEGKSSATQKSVAEITASKSVCAPIRIKRATQGQTGLSSEGVFGMPPESDESLLNRNEFSDSFLRVTKNEGVKKKTAIAVIELLKETIESPAVRAIPNEPESILAPMPATVNAGQPISSPQIGGRDQSVYQLAGQPKIGEVFDPHRPSTDCLATNVPPNVSDFQPGPCFTESYDSDAQVNVYTGKYLTPTQRPAVEIGRPWYDFGQLCPPRTFLGQHNPVDSQFVVFGDSRVGVASNREAANSSTLVAMQTNLFFNWKLTGTERFAMFVSPSSRGLDSTRYLFDEDRGVSEFNFNVINGFFEGDLGSIWGGLSNQTMPFDLPFAAGIMPLVFQNGVWMEDNILGVAATLPARNIPAWNVANMDVTFFAGYDNLNSPAFGNDANAGRIYGIASFVEALDGYLEMDYAFLDDRQDIIDRSYHNIGVGFTRRYGRWLSNSARVIANAGQDSLSGNTADGVLLLSENSLITQNPYTRVPYLNLFAGFDRPQSAARAGQSGGVLRNTGILFETDVLTGYPTLDASANNTFGGALGINLMPANFSQQLVLEAAGLGVLKDSVNRIAVGSQYGVGMRYQRPLTNSVLLRGDAMYGFFDESPDVTGVRLELRKKF